MPSTIADLTAQLKLNNANFKRGLTAAQKSLHHFKGQVNMIKGAIAGAFTVTAAIAAFKKAIASTQESADGFAIAMGGAREATTAMFASIMAGDMGDLAFNMSNAAQAGREYAEAMDEIADKSRAISVQTALIEARTYKLREIATNTAESDDKRIVAYREIAELLGAQIIKEKELADETLQKAIDKQITRNNLTQEQGEMIKDFIVNYDTLTEKELRATRQVQILQETWKDLYKMRPLQGPMPQDLKEQMDIAQQNIQNRIDMMDEEERAYYDIQEALNKLTDEERDHIASILIEASKLERKLQSLQNEATRGIGAIERKSKDAKKEVEDLNKELATTSDSLEDWMTQPFWGGNTGIGAAMSLGGGEFRETLQELLEAGPGIESITDEADKLNNTVFALISSFDGLGYAMAGAIDGAEDSFSQLGQSILSNIGGILAASDELWLTILGTGLQIVGGAWDYLDDQGNVVGYSSFTGPGYHNVEFTISGANLYGTLTAQEKVRQVVT